MRVADKLKCIESASANFTGHFHDLERAAGMLMLGDAVGWKVLCLVHDKKTLAKYEKILGISVREAFPDRGPMAKRSLGLAIVDKLGDFWKAVRGEVRVANRHQIR